MFISDRLTMVSLSPGWSGQSGHFTDVRRRVLKQPRLMRSIQECALWVERIKGKCVFMIAFRHPEYLLTYQAP